MCAGYGEVGRKVLIEARRAFWKGLIFCKEFNIYVNFKLNNFKRTLYRPTSPHHLLNKWNKHLCPTHVDAPACILNAIVRTWMPTQQGEAHITVCHEELHRLKIPACAFSSYDQSCDSASKSWHGLVAVFTTDHIITIVLSKSRKWTMGDRVFVVEDFRCHIHVI